MEIVRLILILQYTLVDNDIDNEFIETLVLHDV